MLLEINRAGFEEFSRIDLANKMEFVISYDFHFIQNGRSRMVNHRLTPLALNPKGQLWLALASFSLSPRKHFGNVRMWRVTESGNGIVGNRDVREYSLVDGKWHDSTPIVLTETEQQLLMIPPQETLPQAGRGDHQRSPRHRDEQQCDVMKKSPDYSTVGAFFLLSRRITVDGRDA